MVDGRQRWTDNGGGLVRMTSLEMLWERTNPAEALRERFGLADAAAATAWVARVLGEEYGVRLAHCDRIVMSHLNALAWVRAADGTRLILKWTPQSSEFPRLAALAEVSAWLEDHGVPASVPLRALRGGRQVERDGVSLGLQRVIDGDLLDVTDADEVRAAGVMLARMHEALAECPAASRLQDPARPARPLRERILAWIDEEPAQLTQATREGLRRMVVEAGDEPQHRQLVHGDYRSANVLCRRGAVVGVLDLEEARWDLPITELARQAVLIGTRYHDWGPVPRHTHECLREGYESVRPLTGAEQRWWNPLVLWFTLLMVPAGDDPTGWGRSALGLLPGRDGTPRGDVTRH